MAPRSLYLAGTSAAFGLLAQGPNARLHALEHIVAGVRQIPGLVKGHWTASSDSSRSHTLVTFNERAAAEAFAADVRANDENQAQAGVANVSLEIEEIVAET